MSPFWPITLVHVCCVTIGLISGALSMLFRKGSGLHRVAGTFFFVSMLSASGAGAFLASFVHPNRGNVLGSVVTFYLVATAWVAAKRRERSIGVFDFAALAVAFAIGTAAMTWGARAASSPTHLLDRYPAPLYFVFGSIALLFAASDVRMLVRGGVAGAQRVKRHLWRMSLAFLFALASGYPGQLRLFPKAWRDTNLLFVPHVLVAGAMVWWMVRISRRKREVTA